MWNLNIESIFGIKVRNIEQEITFKIKAKNVKKEKHNLDSDDNEQHNDEDNKDGSPVVKARLGKKGKSINPLTHQLDESITHPTKKIDRRGWHKKKGALERLMAA